MQYERPEMDLLHFQMDRDVITASPSEYVEDVTKPGVITPPGSF